MKPVSLETEVRCFVNIIEYCRQDDGNDGRVVMTSGTWVIKALSSPTVGSVSNKLNYARGIRGWGGVAMETMALGSGRSIAGFPAF